MSIEEAILYQLRALTSAEQEEVLRFAEKLRTGNSIGRELPRERSQEMRWVRENRAAYVDQWVVVEGDRLIAADQDAMKVFQSAIAEGIQSPFVVHIVSEDFAFCAGLVVPLMSTRC